MTVLAPLTRAYNLFQEAALLVLVAGVVSMIVRYRRSRTEQRLQLKWFMYATAVSAVALLVAAQFGNDPLPEFEVVFPLIPAAVGIAILKYRLYDIDRLISRTVSYAIVTGLLVGLYAGLVLLATRVLSVTSPVAVAVATLAAAALFTPLRLARAAGGGPPVQPGPLRRRPDRRRLRRPAPRRGRPGRGPVRSADRGQHRRRARPYLGVDRPGRPTLR